LFLYPPRIANAHIHGLRMANSEERVLKPTQKKRRDAKFCVSTKTCREKVARRGASVRTAVRAPRLTTFFARLARDGTNKG
jgi:hypothetical protein